MHVICIKYSFKKQYLAKLSTRHWINYSQQFGDPSSPYQLRKKQKKIYMFDGEDYTIVYYYANTRRCEGRLQKG